MKNLFADGRGGWVADGRLCSSRVASKIFVLVISWNFRKKFYFLFREIFLQFREIQNNVCHNFVFREILTMLFCSHPMLEWSEGGRAGTALVHPHANADCPLIVFPLYCFPFFHL